MGDLGDGVVVQEIGGVCTEQALQRPPGASLSLFAEALCSAVSEAVCSAACVSRRHHRFPATLCLCLCIFLCCLCLISECAASVLHLNVLLRSIFVGHILVCSCLLGCLKAVFNRPSVRPFLVGVQWHRCESGDVDSETYIYMPLHANKTRAGTWSLKSRASEWRIDMTRTPE